MSDPPFRKGDRVRIILSQDESWWFHNKEAIVTSIRYKDYPSGKRTPGWWVNVRCGYHNGLRGSATLHANGLEKL